MHMPACRSLYVILGDINNFGNKTLYKVDASKLGDPARFQVAPFGGLQTVPKGLRKPGDQPLYGVAICARAARCVMSSHHDVTTWSSKVPVPLGFMRVRVYVYTSSYNFDDVC